LKVIFIGSGPLGEEMVSFMTAEKIDFHYPGFIQQSDLPEYYNSSKIFLFPTKCDTWGVVVNEACASGLPVITCENAGIADDLVIHNYNGFILPLEERTWCDHILQLLDNPALYNEFSKHSLEMIKKFSIENAVKGFMDAIESLN
jgi:glycosyltransferase involved in cell wall biosynthesis